MHDLFEAVRQAILALGPQVREEFRRHYVAYKTQTKFVDVVPQKRRLLLTLNMRFDELSDPRGLAADITNLGLWGNGDVQVELENDRQIPYAMDLVRQVFAAKQPGGLGGRPRRYAGVLMTAAGPGTRVGARMRSRICNRTTHASAIALPVPRPFRPARQG